jgi:two-component system response regulator PilR (NtrC family)
MTLPSDFSLLVVDDEPDLRTLYELALLREGYEVETAGTVEEAWSILESRRFSVVITDMRLPDGTGLDLLTRMEAGGRLEKTLVITAFGSSENAVQALKAGAFDYLTKPVDLRQFRSVVASALGRHRAVKMSLEPARLPPAASKPVASAKEAQAPISPPMAASASELSRDAAPVRMKATPGQTANAHFSAFSRMVGQSPGLRQVRLMIEKVAKSMAPVLIHGESGTGKELVARSVHELSSRGTQAFIAVNCGAIPEQLLEAEFFGYRKGSFTGAQENRAGFFQAADGGTLFLDEIGDLPLAMQSKLLRCIQERAVRPVGAVSELPVNVRILSATHKDLMVEVAQGRFRQDLFYRLNVIQLVVPPLRERKDDLPAISAQVLARLARDAGMSHAPQLTPEALARLAGYEFPGNIRELENLLHRAVALTGGHEITPFDLGFPENTLEAHDTQDDAADHNEESPCDANASLLPPRPSKMPRLDHSDHDLPNDLQAYLDAIEKRVLLQALTRYNNNRTAAGASLGLSLRQMRYRMARLNVSMGAAGSAGGPSDQEGFS